MKILLTTLNAKYIHSSLALAYLRSYCEDEKWKIKVREFTINEKTEHIMAEIFRERPDIIAFSVYIWNETAVLEICRDYKQVCPETLIILGGPQVSYDAREVLCKNDCIDYVVRGEGEYTLKELLNTISLQKPPDGVKGVTYRDGGLIIGNPDRELINELDKIPFPYQGDLSYYNNRTIYYETSRGCPYNCSYCLSSTIKGVRFFSMQRVKDDLSYLIHQGVREIKFVDRTFNCHEERACEIMEFIIAQNGRTRFHFEISADILSPEFLSFLKTVPTGLFDFEIGVQSTNEQTLRAVNRNNNWKKLKNNIQALRSAGNIHLHLDLIAGLPGEDFLRFGRSFNDVYHLQPDVIQLGFLKLLKGSEIRGESGEHGYIYQTNPPYQILANRYLDYARVLLLQRIEELLERYYNSANMPLTLDYIVKNIFAGNAFAFFEDFASFWEDNGYFAYSYKKEKEYSILMEYIKAAFPKESRTLNDILKYDYYSRNLSHELPRHIDSHNPQKSNEILYALLKNQAFLQSYLPEFGNKTPREIRRLVHLEFFQYEPFEYSQYESPMPFLFVYDPVRKTARSIIEVPANFIV